MQLFACKSKSTGSTYPILTSLSITWAMRINVQRQIPGTKPMPARQHQGIGLISLKNLESTCKTSDAFRVVFQCAHQAPGPLTTDLAGPGVCVPLCCGGSGARGAIVGLRAASL